ncbi:lantibiotic dehydratase [Kitasatospora sp. NPDC086801]|uniref:lantibiotic dehydratase n=1 Tax=Kitasatospora sp. NPDC086801 TaxID=3364066 RepID=UPI003801D583
MVVGAKSVLWTVERRRWREPDPHPQAAATCPCRPATRLSARVLRRQSMQHPAPRGPSSFACADIALLRAAVRPSGRTLQVGPLSPRNGETALVAQLGYLREAAEDAVLCEALAVSSPSLAGTLDRVRLRERMKPKDVRGAVEAVLRYRLRMAGRATPFGLMAGVAEAGFGGTASVRWGTDHVKSVKPDMEWLLGVVKDLERRPGVLERARIVRNDLCFVRGDRLVLPFVPSGADTMAGGAGSAKEVSVRFTAPVRMAWELTRVPVPCHEVRARISAECANVAPAAVADLLRTLVAREIVLTDLRPPLGGGDPLGHVLARLTQHAPAGGPDAHGSPAITRLTSIERGLAGFAKAPLGEGRGQWNDVARQMRKVHRTDQVIQVDLGLSARVVLPHAVAGEVERAADVLWRCAPPVSLPAHLRQFHADFVERYGTGRPVPVKEALDPDTGLGAPAGYLVPPSDRRAPPTDHTATDRDLLLVRLAQEASQDGTREVMLDESLIEALSPGSGAAAPPSGELLTQLMADSLPGLEGGDFRLVVVGASTLAGSFAGRFASLLPRADERFAEILRALPAPDGDAVHGQLRFPTFHSRGANVAQVPQWLEHAIGIGTYADPTAPNTHRLDDLSLMADPERLTVVSSKDGRRIAPGMPCMLDPKRNSPNAARLLHELGSAGSGALFWNWGKATALPYLPRVRHGRTVLSPARWLLQGTALTQTDDFAAWRTGLLAWLRKWRVPNRVRAGVADNRLELDLAEPSHQVLLHRQLRRHPDTTLEETPAGGAFGTGWLADHAGHEPRTGHTNEIAFTLLRRAAPAPTTSRPRTRTTTLTTLTTDHGRSPVPAARSRNEFLPGEEWLYAKIYSSADRHHELIAHHLPRLIEALPPTADRWFFIRYRDPDPHLRLRFHLSDPEAAGPLLGTVSGWARALRDAGLIGRLALDTYEPEIQRYGGPGALAEAEHAFCADSRAVMEQLATRSGQAEPTDLMLLAAANYADIVRQLLGAEAGDPWVIDNIRRTEHHAVFTKHRATALRLINPSGGWPGLRALDHGATTLASWQRRSEPLRSYGELLRAQAESGSLPTDLDNIVHSLLHLHHNRLIGVDRTAEGKSYALLRGAVRAHHQRSAQRR